MSSLKFEKLIVGSVSRFSLDSQARQAIRSSSQEVSLPGTLLLKMISSLFCAVSVLNVCEHHMKECESMLFVKKYVRYL